MHSVFVYSGTPLRMRTMKNRKQKGKEQGIHSMARSSLNFAGSMFQIACAITSKIFLSILEQNSFITKHNHRQ